jgi:hypothetical protein
MPPTAVDDADCWYTNAMKAKVPIQSPRAETV